MFSEFVSKILIFCNHSASANFKLIFEKICRRYIKVISINDCNVVISPFRHWKSNWFMLFFYLCTLVLLLKFKNWIYALSSVKLLSFLVRLIFYFRNTRNHNTFYALNGVINHKKQKKCKKRFERKKRKFN